MILHSIVSPRDIFYNRTDNVRPAEYRRISGGLVELDNGRVKRLISTDPKMYLDKRYFPYSQFRG